MIVPKKFPIPEGERQASCRSCSAPVFWIVTETGKRMPVDPDGTSHFATCPNASTHRKPRPKKSEGNQLFSQEDIGLAVSDGVPEGQALLTSSPLFEWARAHGAHDFLVKAYLQCTQSPTRSWVDENGTTWELHDGKLTAEFAVPLQHVTLLFAPGGS